MAHPSENAEAAQGFAPTLATRLRLGQLYWGRYGAAPGARPSTGQYDHNRPALVLRAARAYLLAARMWDVVGLPSPECDETSFVNCT